MNTTRSTVHIPVRAVCRGALSGLAVSAALVAVQVTAPAPAHAAGAGGTPAAPTIDTAFTASEVPWWQQPAKPVVSTTTVRTTKTVTLPGDVLFQPDSSNLTTASASQLAAVQARYLTPDPQATVVVVGHVDAGNGAPDSPDAMTLSQNRATSVAAYFTAHGITPTAIQTTGVGATDPVDTSGTATGRAANRRCELQITTTAP